MRMRNRLSKCSKHVAFAACMLALGGSFSACQDEYTLDDAKPVWLNSSIYETLESNGNYTNYLRLIADPDVNTGESDESSLVQILSKTGSKTVFVANDQAWQNFFDSNKNLPETNPWHNAQNYGSLSKSQKRLLLHTSMLNNAIVMENLASSSGTTPMRGQYLRRYTDIEVVDSVTRIAVADLPKTYWSIDKQATEEGASSPEVDQWSRIRNGGLLGYDSIYMVLDSSLSMMVYFTNEYMAQKQITDEDFRIIMGRERITTDVHLYDAHLDSADIVCENGYINMTEKPLVPLANMAEVIRTNGRTKIFSHLLDRFSVPFQNKTVGNLFSKLYPNDFAVTDTLYTKRYYSLRSFGSTTSGDVVLKNNERGELFAGSGEAVLKYDPGWSGYFPLGANAQEDMGAMFIPNDKQMLEYFNNGGGKALLNEYTKDPASVYTIDDLETLYKDIDQIPLKTIQALINQGMFPNFTTSVPSKMLKLREAITQERIFNESDTKLSAEGGTIDTVMVACNGAVYIMNNVFTPSDYDCVATPAYIRSSNRIMRWAIYSDYEGVNEMGLNYYAYLKAMQSRYTFFVPCDKGMEYYYDPMSFTSKYPRIMRFLYTTGNFPFATKTTPEGKNALAQYNIETGEIKEYNKANSQSTNKTEIVNRLRQILEHNTIIHKNGVNMINTEEDEYYLSKNGMGIKVTRDETGVIKAQGGFQLENEREGMTHSNPGILYCNVIEKGDYKNGWAFTLDAPLIPAARSVFSVLSNIKRGQKGESSQYSAEEVKNANPYYEFFRLCVDADWDLITGSGLVDENDPKYDESSSSGITAKTKAVNKYMTFVDDETNNAVDYNVNFFDNFNYTVFAPTNEAVREAIANGLPTWDSIKEDFDNCKDPNTGELTSAKDSLRIQLKITYLTNFIRTHFADNTIFADKSDMKAEMGTNSYNSDLGLFVKAYVQREGGVLKVKDNTSTGQWITAKYTTDDGRDVKNIMTCDRECNSRVKDQTMNGKTTEGTSYAVVHLINGVLNHDELVNGKYPDLAKQAEENGGKAARAYIQKFAIR